MLRQTTLFKDPSIKSTQQVVNVASVPQRSPFRYPGGKTWFVPYFKKWIISQHKDYSVFVEPFCGGAIVSLTAAFENLVSNIIMGEIDEEVAAVWESVINSSDSNWLAEQIIKLDLTLENANRIINTPPSGMREMALQTIIKNRIYHGGILAKGSGFLKYGENGKGIRSRWYPETIAKRLLEIENIKHKMTFKKIDAFRLISDHKEDDGALFFIDPPYMKASKRLYKYFDIDHAALFKLMSDVKGDFLMTYDDTDEVRSLAEKYNFSHSLIPMQTTHHIKKYELVVSKII